MSKRKDRNQFGSLHELRALVLRDGFRLEAGSALDLTSAQATPELATQRLTIREKSAGEIIRNLKENTPLYLFHENVAELYLGRWTREPRWPATVYQSPSKLDGGLWDSASRVAPLSYLPVRPKTFKSLFRARPSSVSRSGEKDSPLPSPRS